MSFFQKTIVLTFDEMYISHKIEIDKKYEQVVGSYKTCQVSVARDLFKKYKQVVYYKFDQSLTVDIVKKVILDLYDAEFIVVALICD